MRAPLALLVAVAALASPLTLPTQERDALAMPPADSPAGPRLAGKLLMQAARNGIPVVVNEGGMERILTASDAPDVRPYQVRLSTDHLVQFHRAAREGIGHLHPVDKSLPVVETTVEWSTADAAYGITRIAVGFWQRRLWIVHEQTENADSGLIACFVRYVW